MKNSYVSSKFHWIEPQQLACIIAQNKKFLAETQKHKKPAENIKRAVFSENDKPFLTDEEIFEAFDPDLTSEFYSRKPKKTEKTIISQDLKKIEKQLKNEKSCNFRIFKPNFTLKGSKTVSFKEKPRLFEVTRWM